MNNEVDEKLVNYTMFAIIRYFTSILKVPMVLEDVLKAERGTWYRTYWRNMVILRAANEYDELLFLKEDLNAANKDTADALLEKIDNLLDRIIEKYG